MKSAILGLCLALWASASVACTMVAPVVSLSFQSPYLQSDPARSTYDPEARVKMVAALDPVDRWLQDIARLADQAQLGDRAAKDCATRHLVIWARANALSSLNSMAARLTIDARLAGIALVARRLNLSAEDRDIVAPWLARRMDVQIIFWQEEAPQKARLGNLRAWAALAAWAVGDLAGDQEMQGWARASIADILATVQPDGSLPMEMRRGKFALHYQLHALAPLVVLHRSAYPFSPQEEAALERAVHFVLSDLVDGAKSAAHSGVTQSYFDGTEKLMAHELAWLEAYLSLSHDPLAQQVAARFRPFRHSKLGGDQALIWSSGGN